MAGIFGQIGRKTALSGQSPARYADPSLKNLKSLEAKGSHRTVVTLSPTDILAARRLLSLLAGDSDSENENDRSMSRERMVRRAREILVNRRRRAERFTKSMFGEPAWEILLVLYTLEDGPRVSANRLADLTESPRSTATRWLNYLEHQQLVSREPHPNDKRTTFICLTEKGRSNLELYLSETVRLDL